ncbi:MAG TPA: DUF2520 domain-containing protein [Aquaticitalea sp.]|nr:DUF2520 domain-containing protein [Aquaticitalea sp.]HNU58911.1 DUF2520 domain-containing protein [Aquaticitalea sp.]
MVSIVLIGAGNVATQLYKAFSKANGIVVKQWYGRHLDSIASYRNEVAVTDDISQLVTADVYIISVSDDAISTVSEQLPFNDRLVVHTSGSVGIHDLNMKNRRGVFYPLQTFNKASEMSFVDVPICIEALQKEDEDLLKSLANTLGSKSYKLNTTQRRVLHLAAVYVNNFTNQLYRVAHEITESEGVDFEILKPLILETASKIQHMSPYMAQTGPAKRNDKKTIKKHLKMLENEHHKAIYELMTSSIQKTHGR